VGSVSIVDRGASCRTSRVVRQPAGSSWGAATTAFQGLVLILVRGLLRQRYFVAGVFRFDESGASAKRYEKQSPPDCLTRRPVSLAFGVRPVRTGKEAKILSQTEQPLIVNFKKKLKSEATLSWFNHLMRRWQCLRNSA